MRLVLLKEIPDDPVLRREWNALVERVEQTQVFFTYEWALAVQRAYAATLHPLIFIAYGEDESLCGVAALASDTTRCNVSFLCATTGDYCDFLSLPADKFTFVDAVLQKLSEQGEKNVTLTNLPADSSTVAALRQAIRGPGYLLFARTAYVCAQVSLAELERRPGENKPVLPRKKMLRRFLNAMGREGPVHLDHARSWDAIAPILPQFMRSHVARFLVTGRISNIARPERRVFLQELAKLLSASGWVDLTRMMSGANTFAWNYGFQFQDTWFWYQPTFDSDLEKYSPGFCMLAKVIEEAAESKSLATVDLGLGAEEYKERFANRTRETLYVTLTSSPGRHVREIMRYRAAEVVRKSPRGELAARALIARVQSLRRRVADAGAWSAMRWLGKRCREMMQSETEVLFYEWAGSARTDSDTLQLQPLDLDMLASAVMENADDPETLAYLLRAAVRLREGKAEGFGLVDSSRKVLHIAWATDFDGFQLSELNFRVSAPSADCAMIFDCWTPMALRGHGYYGQAVELLATLINKKGKHPWIFSGANNSSSVRGLQNAGFERRYSLIRRHILGLQRISGETAPPHPAVAEISGRV